MYALARAVQVRINIAIEKANQFYPRFYRYYELR